MTVRGVGVTRWEARRIETAVLAILGACLEARAPGRTTCPDCRALIAAGLPCPICTEYRRRQHQQLHRQTA
jgi:recombinational DNA repair protein RecR